MPVVRPTTHKRCRGEEAQGRTILDVVLSDTRAKDFVFGAIGEKGVAARVTSGNPPPLLRLDELERRRIRNSFWVHPAIQRRSKMKL